MVFECAKLVFLIEKKKKNETISSIAMSFPLDLFLNVFYLQTFEFVIEIVLLCTVYTCSQYDYCAKFMAK